MYKTKVKLFDEFLRLNVTFIKYFLDLQTIIARVVELVDTLDSKSSSAMSDGSSPSSGTIQEIYMHLAFKVVIPVVIYQTPVVITLPLFTQYT